MGVSAYTIVSRAYVPQARVLCGSFLRHHPDGQFWALLVDDARREIADDEEPFSVLRLEDLDLDLGEIHRMAMLFGSRLIAAIKPWICEHLLGRAADHVIYIDSDFVIFASLDPLARAAREHGVALVPHVREPIPVDGLLPDYTTILGVGTFNAGMFAVGRKGQPFLDFLKERLRRECRTDVPAMRVNEQRWLDFVPALFDHSVVRDPGFDVAPWNIHERHISKKGGHYLVSDQPLRAFHFSGFDPRIPSVLSSRDYWERPRTPMSEEPDLVQLCNDYREALNAAGFDRHHEIPFAFDYLPNGSPIYGSLRSLYAKALHEAEAAGQPGPPDPFDPAQSTEFTEWFTKAYVLAGECVPANLADPPNPQVFRSDWLSRMGVGPAGERRHPGVVHLLDGMSGTVLYGPNALLEAGSYRVTVEASLDAEAELTGEWDSLLIEVLLDGYALASGKMDANEVVSEPIDFIVPAAWEPIALSAGLQIRVSSRRSVRGVIRGVLVERMESNGGTVREPIPTKWISAMSTGDVGRRTSDQAIEGSGEIGFIAVGPHWRLDGGTYRVTIALNGVDRSRARGDDAVVGLAEAVIHGYVVSFVPITRGDLTRGVVAFDFAVGGRWKDNRFTQVEIRVREQQGVSLTVMDVEVRPTTGTGDLVETVAWDWLPALWVSDAAIRVGVEIHSVQGSSGVLAFGPGWRLSPGSYRLEVEMSSTVDGEMGPGVDGSTLIEVMLDGVVSERVALSSVDLKAEVHAVDFSIVASKMPAPLMELTLPTDVRIISAPSTQLRVRSAKLSKT